MSTQEAHRADASHAQRVQNRSWTREASSTDAHSRRRDRPAKHRPRRPWPILEGEGAPGRAMRDDPQRHRRRRDVAPPPRSAPTDPYGPRRGRRNGAQRQQGQAERDRNVPKPAYRPRNHPAARSRRHATGCDTAGTRFTATPPAPIQRKPSRPAQPGTSTSHLLSTGLRQQRQECQTLGRPEFRGSLSTSKTTERDQHARRRITSRGRSHAIAMPPNSSPTDGSSAREHRHVSERPAARRGAVVTARLVRARARRACARSSVMEMPPASSSRRTRPAAREFRRRPPRISWQRDREAMLSGWPDSRPEAERARARTPAPSRAPA